MRQISISDYAVNRLNPIVVNDPLGDCPDCPGNGKAGDSWTSPGGATYNHNGNAWMRDGGDFDEMVVTPNKTGRASEMGNNDLNFLSSIVGGSNGYSADFVPWDGSRGKPAGSPDKGGGNPLAKPSEYYFYSTAIPSLASSFITETKYGRWVSMGALSYSTAPYSRQTALMREASLTGKYLSGATKTVGLVGGALTMGSDVYGVYNHYKYGPNSPNAVSPTHLVVDGVATYMGMYGGLPGVIGSTVYFATSPIIWSTPGNVPKIAPPKADATYVAPPAIQVK